MFLDIQTFRRPFQILNFLKTAKNGSKDRLYRKQMIFKTIFKYKERSIKNLKPTDKMFLDTYLDRPAANS